MLGRCNLSTILFTLAQLSPIDQVQRANLRTVMESIATILSCLQAGQADLLSVAANLLPLIHQQNIFLVKFERQSSLLTIVKRGLPAITPGKIQQFFVTVRCSVGPSLSSLAYFRRRRYQT